VVSYLGGTHPPRFVSLHVFIGGAPSVYEPDNVHIVGTPFFPLSLQQPDLREAIATLTNSLNDGRDRGKKRSLTDRWRSSLMNLAIVAKAVSGFIDLPAGLKWYVSSSSQTKRSFACSQLESMASGKGLGEPRVRLPLSIGVVLPFPFDPSDRWGP
jgi:hypothetical protein